MSNQLIDKALAYIGENIQQPLIIRTTQVSIMLTFAKSVSVTAPTVSGYTFLCWVYVTTSGWIGSCQVSNATASSTTVWNATYGTSSSNTGNVNCYAMYIRSDLA